MSRVHNFSAGPAALPLDVLEIIRNDIPDWQGTGMSVMEISHRSKEFIELAARCEANLRQLLSIPDDYTCPLDARWRDAADGDGAAEPGRTRRHGRLCRNRQLGQESGWRSGQTVPAEHCCGWLRQEFHLHSRGVRLAAQ